MATSDPRKRRERKRKPEDDIKFGPQSWEPIGPFLAARKGEPVVIAISDRSYLTYAVFRCIDKGTTVWFGDSAPLGHLTITELKQIIAAPSQSLGEYRLHTEWRRAPDGKIEIDFAKRKFIRSSARQVVVGD